MANSGVDGRLTIFGGGEPSGFTVEVYRSGIIREMRLNDKEAQTEAEGKFSAHYPPVPLGAKL
jgi:hypothetical protein